MDRTTHRACLYLNFLCSTLLACYFRDTFIKNFHACIYHCRDYTRFKFSAVLTVITITSIFQVMVKPQYMVEMDKALSNKVLSGHAFRNLTMKSIVECFIACLEDCLCMSFQTCQNTECQLLSSNQFQSPSALVTMMGCSYFDMVPNSVRIYTIHVTLFFISLLHSHLKYDKTLLHLF